jgi:hypothetical protein
MQEMRVELRRILRQLRHHHAGLAETPRAVGRRIADQVPQPLRESAPVAGLELRLPPGTQHAQRLLVEIFRQIGDFRRDLAMHRMEVLVGREPQRDDVDREPAQLQRANLLRDEGLRQTRIALEDEDQAGHRSHIHYRHPGLEPGSMPAFAPSPTRDPGSRPG